ncbi:MAG TPA: coproporphyrinogen III oxidase [Ruminococcaceae bacterium]|nr:coproporphyrinogen III oxidase [Oscillospiraceae bacterium]
MNNIGLYLHIPFCKTKCPYCDFYSMRSDESDRDMYTISLVESMENWSDKLGRKADTLYFGGGTPSILGGKNIAMLTRRAKNLFGADGEITVECNPSAVEEDFFETVADAGVNRISLGVQSVIEKERKKLGRLSDRKLIEKRVEQCRTAGINNISLDVMLGVQDQTMKSLSETLDFCADSGAAHISAYMLKIEEGTQYYRKKDSLNLPDEDTVADMYLAMSERLRANGFEHYEISNFTRPGFEGKHNLKYWNCEEYLGLGPSAHSFIDGKRFFYPRDIEYFKDGGEPISDGNGGDEEEYIMLRLRLKDGIIFEDFEKKFGKSFSRDIIKKAEKFIKNSLMKCNEKSMALTEKGFLLSNSIIADLI